MNSCNGQEIFHHCSQPLCIIINIRINLLFHHIIQAFPIMKKHICISGDRAKRSPKIMRNGPQQICPQLLILCHNGVLLFLLRISDIFHGKGTFIDDRKYNAVCKGIQFLFLHGNSNHTIYIISHANCQIQTSGLTEMMRRCAGTFSVLIYPTSYVLFLFIQQFLLRKESLFRKKSPFRQNSILRHIGHNAALHQPGQLCAGNVQHFIFAFCLLQLTVGIKQNLGAKSLLR